MISSVCFGWQPCPRNTSICMYPVEKKFPVCRKSSTALKCVSGYVPGAAIDTLEASMLMRSIFPKSIPD